MTKQMIAGLIVFACMAGWMPVYGEEQGEDIFPSLEVFEKMTRPVVRFDHDVHNEQNGLEDDCSVCHHLWENGTLVEGESSEDQYCSDCHSIRKTADNKMPLMKAFHLQCKECHEAKRQGPVLCGECHVKQK